MMGRQKGFQISEETREKMSESHKGKNTSPRSEETKAKISKTMLEKKIKRKPFTQEHRDKISAYQKSRIRTRKSKPKEE